MYRTLNPNEIIETVTQLRDRIRERFPGAGLGRVAEELLDMAHEAVKRSAEIARPHVPLRVAAGLLATALLAVFVSVLVQLKVEPRIGGISDLIQGVDAAMNSIVVLGAAIFFLFTLEARIKRKRALNVLHELRVLAHIIDMHQLTKDPERVTHPEFDTAASPKRKMTRFELSRYLDYCSEMLSLIGKLAALHVQSFDDVVVLNAVDEVEDLTTGLSRKIWQKITLLYERPIYHRP